MSIANLEKRFKRVEFNTFNSGKLLNLVKDVHQHRKMSRKSNPRIQKLQSSIQQHINELPAYQKTPFYQHVRNANRRGTLQKHKRKHSITKKAWSQIRF